MSTAGRSSEAARAAHHSAAATAGAARDVTVERCACTLEEENEIGLAATFARALLSEEIPERVSPAEDMTSPTCADALLSCEMPEEIPLEALAMEEIPWPRAEAPAPVAERAVRKAEAPLPIPETALAMGERADERAAVPVASPPAPTPMEPEEPS